MGSMPADRPRSRHYYVENFEQLVGTVLERYQDLLTLEELDFVDRYRALSPAARFLWLRLTSRKGPLFRQDRLSYAEVPDLVGTALELRGATLLDDAPDAEPADLLKLLMRAELEMVIVELGKMAATRGRRKSELVGDLLERFSAPLLNRAVRHHVEVLRPLGQRALRVFRLLFFGNLRQDWTELLLADLQVWRYEPYPLQNETRLFPTREAIDDTVAIHAQLSLARALLREKDLGGALAVARYAQERIPAWHLTARTGVEHILGEVASSLERAGELVDALELYAATTRPPARERRARILARLDRTRAALEVCRNIERSPRDESERLFAPRFSYTLRRRLGQIPAAYRARRSRRLLQLPRSTGAPIEAEVLEELARQGCPGIHSENWLWRSLFGLSFWDIIFLPVPGAFQHPFQSAPLDLYDPAFRSRREAAVTVRLQEIEGGEWPAARILEVWSQKEGTRNALVSWSPTLRASLELALSPLLSSHLAAVCRRLSRDLRRYRSGFPDLFVQRDQAPGYELLEVKGPGDQLRPEQRGWLDYFEHVGIPATVLAVEWR